MQNSPAPLALPRETLPPNMYSGAFLLSQFLTMSRGDFKLHSIVDGTTRIYTYSGRYYAVPFQRKEPPAGYKWRIIGRAKGRDMYMANRGSQ